MVLFSENGYVENTMPTIDDVSKLANVSKATVSRVLTGTRGVREDSREAVLRAVEELNYRPNFAAQNLASQTSSYIGLVLPAHDDAFSSTLLPRFSQYIKALNKNLLVQYAQNSAEQQQAINDLQHQCVAVVVVDNDNTARGQNVIAFDPLTQEGAQYQGYDFAFATESACRYVMGKGHRNVALLIDSPEDAASQQMIEGYRNALQNFSQPFNRQLLLAANDNVEQGLLTLINSFTKYSAIIVKRDRYAAEAMRLLREFTIAVPQEVSLISLEDSPLASLLYPPLTCISYPIEQLLESCIQRVRLLIEGRASTAMENKPIIGRLVSRASVSELNVSTR